MLLPATLDDVRSERVTVVLTLAHPVVLSSCALIVGRLPTDPWFSLFACTTAPFHFVYYHDCAAPERPCHDQNWCSCWSSLINLAVHMVGTGVANRAFSSQPFVLVDGLQLMAP